MSLPQVPPPATITAPPPFATTPPPISTAPAAPIVPPPPTPPVAPPTPPVVPPPAVPATPPVVNPPPPATPPAALTPTAPVVPIVPTAPAVAPNPAPAATALVPAAASAPAAPTVVQSDSRFWGIVLVTIFAILALLAIYFGSKPKEIPYNPNAASATRTQVRTGSDPVNQQNNPAWTPREFIPPGAHPQPTSPVAPSPAPVVVNPPARARVTPNPPAVRPAPSQPVKAATPDGITVLDTTIDMTDSSDRSGQRTWSPQVGPPVSWYQQQAQPQIINQQTTIVNTASTSQPYASSGNVGWNGGGSFLSLGLRIGGNYGYGGGREYRQESVMVEKQHEVGVGKGGYWFQYPGNFGRFENKAFAPAPAPEQARNNHGLNSSGSGSRRG